MFHARDLNKGGKKESVIWKHFEIERRNPKTHRKKGICLHCAATFHDSRLDVFQNHILIECKGIPQQYKSECLYEKEQYDSILKLTFYESKPKRKKQKLQNEDTEASVPISAAKSDDPGKTMLQDLTWKHFSLGPRNHKTHRRTAECIHCHEGCLNPTSRRLHDHITKFCVRIPPDKRKEYNFQSQGVDRSTSDMIDENFQQDIFFQANYDDSFHENDFQSLDADSNLFSCISRIGQQDHPNMTNRPSFLTLTPQSSHLQHGHNYQAITGLMLQVAGNQVSQYRSSSNMHEVSSNVPNTSSNNMYMFGITGGNYTGVKSHLNNSTNDSRGITPINTSYIHLNSAAISSSEHNKAESSTLSAAYQYNPNSNSNMVQIESVDINPTNESSISMNNMFTHNLNTGQAPDYYYAHQLPHQSDLLKSSSQTILKKPSLDQSLINPSITYSVYASMHYIPGSNPNSYESYNLDNTTNVDQDILSKPLSSVPSMLQSSTSSSPESQNNSKSMTQNNEANSLINEIGKDANKKIEPLNLLLTKISLPYPNDDRVDSNNIDSSHKSRHIIGGYYESNSTLRCSYCHYSIDKDNPDHLKEHLIYACKKIPRQMLSDYVKTEFQMI